MGLPGFKRFKWVGGRRRSLVTIAYYGLLRVTDGRWERGGGHQTLPVIFIEVN